MTRFRAATVREVERLGDRIGVEFDGDGAADAAARIDALGGLYESLEAAPAPDGDAGADLFEAPPHPPGDDPHNAWITRFDLRRPDADGALSGLTVAVKDNTCVRGAGLTCGSRAFEGCVPGSHAAVVDRLLDAGARIAGKTNMDELAFGPTSETSAFGPTENPEAPGHVAGGSSAGSAAAVAAGEVDLALGTDTGGSVRIPASYCGVVGITPTYGLVPCHGVVPLAASMDHVGPLARDVETAARGLDAIADPPPGRGASGYADDLGVDPSALDVGVPARAFEEHVSEGVERRVRDAIGWFESEGATVTEVDIPALERSREAWWGIAPAEFAATYATNGCGLGRRGRVEPTIVAAFERIRGSGGRSLGSNVREMLALGAHLDVTYGGHHYARGTNWRARLTDEFDRALSDVDLLAAPATPTTAPEVGGFERGVTPPVNWNTHPANLTGHPAASVPCGEAGGRPVGLQLIGPWHGEASVIDAAHAYEAR